MKKKIMIFTIIILVLIVVLLIFINKRNTISNSKILITKINYQYPYKTVIKVDKHANIYKSKIVDELTADGAPKDNFSKIGTMSQEDFRIIQNIIDAMKKEQIKETDFSESYGIAINLGEDTLYSCAYFTQENVNKLNSILQKYE